MKLNVCVGRKVYIIIYSFLFCTKTPNTLFSCVKKKLDAQLTLSIFRQPVHVSGVSRPIIRRYNRMYTTIGTYYSFEMTVCCTGSNLDTPETCRG